MTELTIAIAELARFCHRSGDIDHRFSPSPTGVQGVAGHQRVYARRPASYLQRIRRRIPAQEPALQLTLRGRADGYDPQQDLVEEIKTCRIPPDSHSRAGGPRLHLAQGRLYAAIIAAQGNLEQHGSPRHLVQYRQRAGVQPQRTLFRRRTGRFPRATRWRASPTGCTRSRNCGARAMPVSMRCPSPTAGSAADSARSPSWSTSVWTSADNCCWRRPPVSARPRRCCFPR